MDDNISVASLMRISDNSRNLQNKKIKASDRIISEQLLKPLLEALGWELFEGITASSLGKPRITYDARKNVYSGRVGGQSQLVAASIRDDASMSAISDLIEYAYNKNTAWALTVSTRNLKLYHTYMNVQLDESGMKPFWQSQIEMIHRSQDDLARYLSATAANNGVLCSIDKDLSSNNPVGLPLTRKLFETTRTWRSRMIEKIWLFLKLSG